MTNLVRNYSPHLNTRSPPTAGLYKVLEMAAVQMLETFLKRWNVRWMGMVLRPLMKYASSLFPFF